mmetsp:Transcript_30061/g.96617  ORF Transcript_30061/g.96617 Transcript_30061/m.96617 type:complete len:249 (+) Transcript_30061:3523-4269(+)
MLRVHSQRHLVQLHAAEEVSTTTEVKLSSSEVIARVLGPQADHPLVHLSCSHVLPLRFLQENCEIEADLGVGGSSRDSVLIVLHRCLVVFEMFLLQLRVVAERCRVTRVKMNRSQVTPTSFWYLPFLLLKHREVEEVIRVLGVRSSSELEEMQGLLLLTARVQQQGKFGVGARVMEVSRLNDVNRLPQHPLCIHQVLRVPSVCVCHPVSRPAHNGEVNQRLYVLVVDAETSLKQHLCLCDVFLFAVHE